MEKDRKFKAALISTILIFSVFANLCAPVSAATDVEIEQAIINGTAYLASVQNVDGSWGINDKQGRTAIVLLKLESRATELGLDPFDNDTNSPTYYEYADNVIAGMDYLLNNAIIVNPLPVQTHGNPDSNGNGQGIAFLHGAHHESYTTGLALCALGASAHPDDRTYNIGGTDYTYLQIAQDVADFLAYGQCDSGPDSGGWGYSAYDNSVGDVWTDNSNGGWATLGLTYGENFGCTIPQWVKDELNLYIDYIQNDVDGGSGYDNPDNWVNILKTGNLLQQMAFYGDDENVGRVQDAIDYLETHWRDANNEPGWGYNVPTSAYHAMFTTMKGLESMGINLIDTDGNGVSDNDWYNQEPSATPSEDFASVLVSQQNNDGSWPQCAWDYETNAILSTTWALLTLEKVAPPPPTPVPSHTPLGIVALFGLVGLIAVFGYVKRE